MIPIWYKTLLFFCYFFSCKSFSISLFLSNSFALFVRFWGKKNWSNKNFYSTNFVILQITSFSLFYMVPYIYDTKNQLSLLLKREFFNILCLWDFSTKLTSSKFLMFWTCMMSLPIKFMVPLPGCVCTFDDCCCCCCNGGGVVVSAVDRVLRILLFRWFGCAFWLVCCCCCCCCDCCWCCLVGLPVLLCVGDDGWLKCGDEGWVGYWGWA